MFKIGKRKISINSEPFVIAELSGNHNGNIKNIFKMIDLASKNKIDAVKLQTYTPDTITIKSKRPEFLIKDKKIYGKIKHFMNFIKKLIPRGRGTKRYLTMQKKKKLSVLAHHLMKVPSIF